MSDRKEGEISVTAVYYETKVTRSEVKLVVRVVPGTDVKMDPWPNGQTYFRVPGQDEPAANTETWFDIHGAIKRGLVEIIR